jgi:acyl-coenzyme A synthetase/AMP-(fatty) acid ligase
MRAGFRAFPISPRNSEQGVANLLQKMNVTHLIVSNDDATRRTAKAACRGIKDTLEVTLLDVPKFTDLYSNQTENFTPLPPLPGTDVSNLALILHSSGKTARPKSVQLCALILQ